jgi:hypothetical protein
MNNPTISDFLVHPAFYLIWFVIGGLGSAFGAFITEKIKGKSSKEIWLSQERWKEQYRLYQLLISSLEDMASSLWSIKTDTRVLTQMGLTEYSTEMDGVNLFPEHKQYLDAANQAYEKVLSAEVGVVLMLSSDANNAYRNLRSSFTQSALVVNFSYFRRIEMRCEAASTCKGALIEAAKKDLKIN